MTLRTLGSNPNIPTMAKCTIVMRSGKELIFECKSVKTSWSKTDGRVTNLEMEGVTGQIWHHIVLNQIDAILWLDDGEKE